MGAVESGARHHAASAGRIRRFLAGLIVGGLLTGCGYTTRSALPARLRTIHVAAFKNAVPHTAEGRRNLYFPLLEVKIRDAIVGRFQFDGNLRIASPEEADLILDGTLVDYQRSVLRYTDDDSPQEYRMQVVVDLTLKDTARGTTMWKEKGFTGETTYFISGPQAVSESTAVDQAVTDLAKRVVERTIEDW